MNKDAAAAETFTVYRTAVVRKSGPFEIRIDTDGTVSSLKLETVSEDKYIAETCIPNMEAVKTAQHKQIKAEYIKNGARVILMGDSLTDNWQRKKAWSCLAPLKTVCGTAILNAGICGDKIQDLLARVKDLPLEDNPPEIVCVMIGTNNMGHRHSAWDVYLGTRNLLKEIRTRCPGTKIILFAIPPFGGFDAHVTPMPAQANKLYQKLADNENVFYFDFSRELINLDNSLKKELYESDKLHFSETGYRTVLAPAFLNAAAYVWAVAPEGKKLYHAWENYLIDRRTQSAENFDLEAYLCAKANLNDFYQFRQKQLAFFNWEKPEEVTALAKEKFYPEVPAEMLRQAREEGLPEYLDTLLKNYPVAAVKTAEK